MKLPTLDQPLDDYIEHHFGVPLTQLIAPVGENQVGESVRHNGVYFNIKNARRYDDPTLPMGVWSHDLKTADWHEVQKLALEALGSKCKDLQLGVWLFESSIHIHGFAGIAPAAILIRELCKTYWDTMHPQMQDGDLEYRTNPINWVNEKLTPQLRLLKLTDTQLDGEEYSWDDWENGLRYEQLKIRKQHSGEWEGPSPKTYKQRLAATEPHVFHDLHQQLTDGVIALDALQHLLDERCAEASPSLSDLINLLQGIMNMINSEMQRRGINLAASGDSSSGYSQSDNNEPPPAGGNSDDNQGIDALRDRADAFVMLKRAAEFLMHDDPHSPVPYLVQTACLWGEKSAPDLYQELFLNLGGQLNIFELMGLDATNKD